MTPSLITRHSVAVGFTWGFMMRYLKAVDLPKLDAGKYANGDGLRFIATGGAKGRWELRYSVNGKRRDHELGSFPTVNLTDARNKASKARVEAAQGFDRVVLKHGGQMSLASSQGTTACDLAPAFLAHHSKGLQARDGGARYRNRFNKHFVNVFGKRPLDAITADELILHFETDWHTSAKGTNDQVLGTFTELLRYAKKRGIKVTTGSARDGLGTSRYRTKHHRSAH